MIRTLRTTLAATAALAVAGCASSGAVTPVRVGDRPAQPSAVSSPRDVAVSANLLGSTAGSLVALFGQPALDVREGSARKLQFLGERCVLDAYLYPRPGRGEPVVTHVDARLPDGRDADGAGCAATLKER